MQGTRTRRFLAKGRTPLVVKGSLPRAFLSLGVFVEIGLLFLGSYLLSQAMLEPLQASAAVVVGGGLFLSLASVLFFYLMWPAKPKSVLRQNYFVDGRSEDVITVSARAVPFNEEAPPIVENTKNLKDGDETNRFHAVGSAGR